MIQGSTLFGSKEKRKVAITVNVDEDLALAVTKLKKAFKDKGMYFSVSEVLEIALRDAIVIANKKLNGSGQNDSDNTFI
jgi:hypothetical protein